MECKKIYIIRHGQTEYNLKGIVQGCGIDSELNERGLRQAAAFFEMYKDFPFDKIYTSTLQRTVQSVQKFIDAGFPYEKLDGLKEIHWGNKEGQAFTPEENDYYLKITRSWQQGDYQLCIEGGESPIAVQERQKIALDYILSKKDEKNILICMHGRAMRILLCLLFNYDLRCMDMFEHNNLCLYEVTYTGKMFILDKYNEQSHLKYLD
ncbi:histidine phosphatase family protein [soil metagenome]